MEVVFDEHREEFIPKAWENPACPLCNEAASSPFEKFGPNHRYLMVQCHNCQLAYLNPRPQYDDAFIETAYANYVNDISNLWTNGDYTPYGRKISKISDDLCDEFASALKTSGRKMLEIGCAFGWMSSIAKRKGWQVTGVDVSEKMVAIARKEFGINALCGDWTKIVPAQESFDFIYCSHVIEHIPNPREWMGEFSKRMSASSLLWIEIPNNQCPHRKLKRFLKRVGLKKDRWALWRTPDHLYEPCLKSFSAFATSNGFEVVDSFTYSRKRRPRSLVDRIYHRYLKWGSNLTVVLKKRS